MIFAPVTSFHRLFTGTLSIETIHCLMVGWQSITWKQCARKLSWPNSGIIPAHRVVFISPISTWIFTVYIIQLSCHVYFLFNDGCSAAKLHGMKWKDDCEWCTGRQRKCSQIISKLLLSYQRWVLYWCLVQPTIFEQDHIVTSHNTTKYFSSRTHFGQVDYWSGAPYSTKVV